MLRPALLLLLITAAGCVSPASPTPTTTPSASASSTTVTIRPSAGVEPWADLAPIPVARTEIACATDGRLAHAVAGFDPATDLGVRRYEYYSVADDAWTSGPDLPVALHHTGLVLHEGALFVFGGYAGPFPFVGLAQAYRLDPGATAWVVETSLPRARGGHATVLAGSDVFLVGGASGQPGDLHAAVDVYNLTTKSWSSAPDLGVARDHLTGGYAGGLVLAVGGREFSQNSNQNTLEALRPGDDQWTRGPPMPTARGGLAGAVRGDRLFAFGGETVSSTFDEVEAYSVANATWERFPSLPAPIHAPCAVSTPMGVHVIAGGPRPGFTTSADHRLLRVDELLAGRPTI